MLNAQGALKFSPNVAHKLAAAVRQETAGCAKVWHNMPKESLAQRTSGVIARGNQDVIS